MFSVRCFLERVCCISVLAMILSGCQVQIPPIPDDTVDRPGSSGNIGYVSRSGQYGPGGEILQPRDSKFNTMTGPGSEPLRVLSSVYFELDQASIDPAEREKLRDSANQILDNPGWNILIEGHCDWRGPTEYNIGLGDRRASSVKEYLISLGIPSERVETRSKGDLESTPEGTEEEMSYDRRADLLEL